MSNIDKRTKVTLCWKCRKSTNGGCNWSRSLKPVDGWTAIEDTLSTNYKDNKSYLVIECPEFVPDDVRKCENCRFFEIKGKTTMYGYCRMQMNVTDVYRYCMSWKRQKKR